MKFQNMSHTPIEREAAIADLVLESEERLKSQESQLEDARNERQKVIDRIRRSCTIFKASCPEAWKVFSEDISTMNALAVMLDRRTPLDLMRHEKEFGVKTGAQEWALEKAFIQGQLEILDSIMGVMNIDPTKIEVRKQKSFLLTFWKKLLNVFAD